MADQSQMTLDEAEFDYIDLMEFVAAAICINRGSCPPRPDDCEWTAAQWAKEHCSSEVFVGNVEAAIAMSEQARGVELRRAFGGYDA